MAYLVEIEDLLAPENFSMVEAGVYRSAFPRSKNIPFLRSLGLRAVVALIPEDYPVHMMDFYRQNGIKLISHGLDGNKWPFKEIDELGILMLKIISIWSHLKSASYQLRFYHHLLWYASSVFTLLNTSAIITT